MNNQKFDRMKILSDVTMNKQKLRFDGTKAMKEVRKVTTEQDRRKTYGIRDAKLRGSITSFENTFRYVIGREGNLKKYIEKVLEKRRGGVIAVEFGGLGLKLFEGFDEGFFRQTIGVSLSDYRTENGKLKEGNGKIIYEDGRQHNIIIGNFFDKEIYEKIDKITKGKNVDLIIERMIAGLDDIPNNFLVIMTILQKWYSTLNEEGLLLVEIPRFAIGITEKWVKLLKKEEYQGMLAVDFHAVRGVLRIHKLKGAPMKLPTLNVYEIKNKKKIP